jgi:tetratricopeptide (TPR) repeat protein
LSDVEREAIALLVVPDLPAQLTDGRMTPERVRELLRELEPRLESGGAVVARAVISGSRALQGVLAQSPEATREREDLQSLQLKAQLACGDLQAAALLAYSLQAGLRSSGRFEKAVEAVESVLVALPQEHEFVPWMLVARAELARHEGNIAEAEDLLTQASDRIANSPASVQETTASLSASILGLRAQIHLDQGLNDLAVKDVDSEFQLLRQARKQGVADPAAWATAYLTSANLRLAYGRYDLLIREVELAIEDLRSLSDPEGRARAVVPQLQLRLTMACIEEGRGLPQFLGRARSQLESIWQSGASDLQTRLICATRLGQLGLLEDDKEGLEFARVWLRRAHEVLVESGDGRSQLDLKDRAFLTALETRASILQGTDEEEQARLAGRLAMEFQLLLRQWLASPLREGGYGFLRYDRRRAILGELLAAQAKLGPDQTGPELALATLNEAASASTLHRRMHASLPTLDEVRGRLLPQGTGALVYFPFGDRSLIFSVDSEHAVELAEGPSERVLSKWALDWMSDLQTPPAQLAAQEQDLRTARISERGTQLASGLFPDKVRQRMRGWSQIYIVGSDLLSELPFEALPVEKDRALGLAKAIAYLPSLPIGVKLVARGQERSRSASYDLCLIAGIIGGGDQEDLPFGDDEVALLTRSFHKQRVHALLGADASRIELLKPGALDATIAHFVTHGAFDSERERSRGLMLSGEDRLWSEDAEGLDAPRLVLISSCGAGRSPAREGDGPVAHLGGAFLLAGSDCVVLSDAQLAYRPTLGLMAGLQEKVAAGATTGEALRLARIQVASSQDTHDPFYWALVRALGLGGWPAMPSPTDRSPTAAR